ncbi:helix-turn-helix transcriptional regulator [Maribellus maritimus]|uniref:helix-turn-helix transcriptional regulator n=1 Tax=Maribellus maritimus TaxID=2870838 RepID=UPI00293E4C8D|nr:helix-turn-helix transcriptional regulator [Maribellus maritimus]
MQIEILAYIVTFIITAGLAVIGISISYQLYQGNKKVIFQILLYQQIFLFSFFIYGIWGNMVIRQLIADFNLNAELNGKLALFIPMIGIPFLVVSWFMLVKFGFNLKGFRIPKGFIYSFFPLLIFVPFIVTFLIHKGKISTPADPDLFIIQILLLLNLIVQALFFAPLLKSDKKGNERDFYIHKKYLALYLLGIVIYSASLNFFHIFGYISTCISILLLFGVNILVPLFFQIEMKSNPTMEEEKNIDFSTFCNLYEISKREAEIILEICTGKTNKAISEKLFITLQTVKDHTHRIYTKTGVKSRVQLANLVREKTGG